MIVDVFQDLKSQLPTVTHYLGAENLGRNDSPPSITWSLLDSSFEAKSVTGSYAAEPKSIGTEVARVSLRLWVKEADIAEGEDQSLADYRGVTDLMRQVAQALFYSAVGVYRLLSLSWLNDNGQALTEFGKACDLEIELRMPITLDLSAIATIATVSDAATSGSIGAQQ